MPNSQNKSRSGNPGKGQPRHEISKASAPKSNPERSDKKQGRTEKGDTGRTSSQGRKSASGGKPE